MLSIAFKCYNLSSTLSGRPQKYPFVIFLEVTDEGNTLKSGYYSLVHWLEQGGGVWGQKNYLNFELPSLWDGLERCEATEQPFETDCFHCKTVTHYGKSA